VIRKASLKILCDKRKKIFTSFLFIYFFD